MPNKKQNGHVSKNGHSYKIDTVNKINTPVNQEETHEEKMQKMFPALLPMKVILKNDDGLENCRAAILAILKKHNIAYSNWIVKDSRTGTYKVYSIDLQMPDYDTFQKVYAAVQALENVVRLL